MSKGAAIANAVAQGINGYFRGINYNIQTEREKKNDEYREEGRARERKEWAAKDQLDTDLKDAAAPRATMTGTVTEGGGNKYLSADPAQAASMQATLAAEAEMKGEAAPTQQAGTGIVGGMAKGNEITTAPVDVAKLNSPDARNDRIAGALRKNGQVERAMTMENSVMDQAAKRLGLKVAELKFADDEFNRKLTDTFASNPNWKEATTKTLTETQVGGLNGMNVTYKESADGKTVEFVGTGADGKTRSLMSVPNTDEGKAKVMAQIMRAPAEVKIGFLVEQAKSERAQANSDRDFDLRRQGQENDQQYRNRMLSIQMAQEGRAAATHKVAMEDAKIPPGVKAKAAVIAEQIKSVGSALNKAMAEGQFDPNNAGTAKLIEQQASLNLQYSKLIQPYLPGQAAGADPLGLGGGGAPAAAPARPGAPAAPAAGAPARATMQAATQPVDVLRGRIIGPLTSMADIEQSAQAGNRQAIAYLQSRSQGQADNASAPRTAAEMLNR